MTNNYNYRTMTLYFFKFLSYVGNKAPVTGNTEGEIPQ